MAVAIDQQHHGFKPFVPSQRCKLQSFTHLNFTMLQFSPTNLTYNYSLKRAIKDVNKNYIHRSISTPCLSLSTEVDDKEVTDTSHRRIEIVGGCGVPRVRALVAEVSISMASGVNPKPVSSGLGGAYFLCSYNGNNIAVAKPIDEEPMACNNPKGFAGQMLGQPGLKRSIRVGETAIRELAAYLLDHGEFAGVPATALVKFSCTAFHVVSSSNMTVAANLAPTNYKIASLQRFVDHDFDAGELGPSGFSVGSVHRIGILDVRLLNLDRHAGNILVKKKKKKYIDDDVGVGEELVPIDHGLCLPEWLDDPYFEWLHWPQASVPFTEAEAEYISNLDPFKDAKLLRDEVPFLRESSIRVLVLCTIFLKRAVGAGMCLADIGGMMTREFCGGGGEEDSSVLENVCEKAKAARMRGIFFTSTANDVQSDQGTTTTSQEEIGMFQFDYDEFHDRSKFAALDDFTRLNIVPKFPRFSSASSSSLNGLCDNAVLDALLHKELDDDDDDEQDGNYKCKLGGVLTRSISFSVQKHNNNNESKKEGICFDEMSENEWQSFLEDFEKLLPEVFEDRKSLRSLKQRLGTSCKFF